MRDRRLGLAVLIVAGLVGVWWASRSEPARRAGLHGVSPARPSTAVPVVGDIVERPGRQPAGPVPAANFDAVPAASGCGTVVDETSASPLFAWIVPDSGDAVVSDLRTGRFELTPSSGLATCAWVHAVGCVPAKIDISGGLPDPCVVRLAPERTSTILVVDASGRGVPGVSVESWPSIRRPELAQARWWIDSRFHLDRPARASRTDETGAFRFPAATPWIAAVGRAPHDSGQWVVVDPGGTTVVELVEGFWIEVVDAQSGAPVAGLDLDALPCVGADRRSAPVMTDARGRARISASSFPVDVRLAGSTAWQAALLPTTDCARTSGLGGDVQTFVRFERLPGESPCRLQLRSCGWTIRLTDRTTGEAIDRPVRVERRGSSDCHGQGVLKFCTVHSPRIEGDAEFTFQSMDGLLTLPCLVELDQDLARGWHTYRDTVLLAAGYVPKALDLPDFDSALVGVEPAVPREIALEPATPRRLKVEHADGTPFAESVWIHSAAHDVLVWKAAGRQDGLHGPFDWFGGDLRVDIGNEGRWSFTLPSHEIESAEKLTLTLSSDPGILIVENVPDGARGSRFIATTGFGVERVEHVARIAGPGRLIFDALAPGTYLVGPAPWVRAVETASYSTAKGVVAANALRTVVRQRETVTIRWNPTWMCDAPMEGRVRILGRSLRDVFLLGSCVPIDSDGREDLGRPPSLHFTRNSPRIPLDPEGRYALPAGGPLVTSIAVCLTDASDWGGFGFTIVRTFEPGTSIEVAFGEVSLRWTGSASAGTLPIEYLTDAARSGGSSIRRRVRCAWDTTTTKVLRAVPSDVSELQVGRWRVPVGIAAGRTCDVVIDDRGPTASGTTSEVPRGG